MPDVSPAPPDFVSYVAGRLTALDSATHRLTGDDVQAERLARELLTMVALRWWWLTRADARHGLNPGQSADVHLTRVYHGEATELGYPQMILNLIAPPATRRRTGTTRLSAADEAFLIWDAARRRLRRRLLIAALAGGGLAVAALCQRGNGNSDAAQAPQARSTVLPTGAERAPAEVTTTFIVRGLPRDLSLPTGEVVKLSADPVRRALLVVAASRADTSPILALGSDGRWRRLDQAPSLAALWMQACALSQDGARVAFGTSVGTTVIDLTTGTVNHFPQPATTKPVWLDSRHLLLGPDVLVDLVSGKTIAIPSGPDDAVTPRRPQDPLSDPVTRLIELLSVGQPATAPARLRRWAPQLPRPLPFHVSLGGQLTELVGPWRGPGFGFDGDEGMVVRVCQPAAVPSVAYASAVVAVIRLRTGKVERALLVDSALSGGVRLVGWADERRVLLSLVRPGRQQIVAWDLVRGGLAIASEVNSDGVFSLPDIGSVV